MMLADLVLAVHLAVILFNVLGLVAVPLGAVCGWRFVRVRWWRLLHVLLLAAVAAQALLGRACILTLWQAALAGGAAQPGPLIAGWVDRLIYWQLPIWVFTALYLAVFGWALALLWLVPPRRAGGAALKAAETGTLSAGTRELAIRQTSGWRGGADRR